MVKTRTYHYRHCSVSVCTFVAVRHVLGMAFSQREERYLVLVSISALHIGLMSSGAAWHLRSCSNAEVVVLEASDRAGGHAHTVDVQLGGRTVPVDTGCVC